MDSVRLVDRDDGRHVLTLSRGFAYPVERVWQAVSTSDELSQWYPATVSISTLVDGGVMDVDYGDGWITTAVITELDPGRVLSFTEQSLEGMPRESDNEIRIELTADDSGCLMHFTQVFDDRPAAASYGAGWIGCLNALDALLADVELAADTTFVARHEELIARLGLDSGKVRSDHTGWEIRFERQLMGVGIPDVWSTLVGEAEPEIGEVVPAAAAPEMLVAGPVVTIESQKSLGFAWLVDGEGAGSVLWTLESGPGGARIVVDQRGMPDTAELIDGFYAGWHRRIEALVAEMLGERDNVSVQA